MKPKKPKHKKTAVALLAGLLAIQGVTAQELTGDVRLACEAILCLSSSVRPGECNPSLSRYYGIHKKKWSDTVSARRSFLRLCPAASADSKMQSLVDAIANGAGRCDAGALNTSLSRSGWDDTSIISNTLPSYCRAWFGHSYTDMQAMVPLYVGEPAKGGFWTEPQNYETALETYNERLRQNAWRWSD